MDRTRLGFTLAAAYNMGIIPFSRGFSDVLGEVDPLFASGGSIGIVLWGMAYFATRNHYAVAPSVVLVFCIEKAFYAFHWAWWMITERAQLEALAATDPISATFFGSYGIGDGAFMVFFGWVAWKHRDALRGEPA